MLKLISFCSRTFSVTFYLHKDWRCPVNVSSCSRTFLVPFYMDKDRRCPVNDVLCSIVLRNTNSIAIFRYNATLFPSTHTLAFLSISLCLRWPPHHAQPISCLDDPTKTTTFILTFYSSDDSWKVLAQSLTKVCFNWLIFLNTKFQHQ